MSKQDNVLLQFLRSTDVVSGNSISVRDEFPNGMMPKLPEAQVLDLGEIAVNIAKGYEVIAIKNIDGEIVYLPFNVATRLLTAEITLDELHEYTVQSVDTLVNSNIRLFNDLEQFKTEINQRLIDSINSVISTLNDEIVVLSGDTDTKITILKTDLEAEIGDVNTRLNSQINNVENELSDKINELSANTSLQIDDILNKIDDVSGATSEMSSTITQFVNEKFAEAESDITTLSNEFESVSLENEQKFNALDDKTSSLNDGLTLLSGETQADIASIHDDVASLDNNLNAWSAQTENDINSLKDDITSLDNNLSAWSAQTENNINSIKDDITALSNEFERVSLENEQKFDTLNAKTSNLNDGLTLLSGETQTNIASIHDDITNLGNDLNAWSAQTENDINSLKGDITVVSGDVKTIDENLALLTSGTSEEIADINNRINELNTHVELTDESIIDLDGKIGTLSGQTTEQINSINGDVEILSNNLIGLSAETSTLHENLSSLDENMSELSGNTDAALEAISDNLSIITDICTNLKNTTDILSSQAESHDDEITLLSGNVVSLSDRVENNVNRIDSDINELSGKCDTLEEEIQAVSSVTINLSSELANTNINVNTLSGEIVSQGGLIGNIENRLRNDEFTNNQRYNKLKESLGFDENGNYTPETEDLQSKNVTEAIDYICKFWLGVDDTNQVIRSITYESLCQLYNEEKLRWGYLYRITNYQATVDDPGFTTRVPVVESDVNTSMGFDIIVRATSNKTLSEYALLARSKDNYYFEDCNVNAWKAKYTIINDKSRFNWADTVNGKGVIYYLQDEYGNEAPYDFKNILSIIDGKPTYTFHDSYNDGDLSMTGAASGNVIKAAYIDGFLNNAIQKLNKIAIVATAAYGNEFTVDAYNIQFIGDYFIDNKVSSVRNNEVIEGPLTAQLLGFEGFDIEELAHKIDELSGETIEKFAIVDGQLESLSGDVVDLQSELSTFSGDTSEKITAISGECQTLSDAISNLAVWVDVTD